MVSLDTLNVILSACNQSYATSVASYLDEPSFHTPIVKEVGVARWTEKLAQSQQIPSHLLPMSGYMKELGLSS